MVEVEFARCDDDQLDGHQGAGMSNPDRSVSVANAKAHLSELLEAVENGERVEITRRGVPVADLVKHETRRPPIDLQWLSEVAGEFPASELDAVELVRLSRDDTRH
jgi:prevent-host-death family protein